MYTALNDTYTSKESLRRNVTEWLLPRAGTEKEGADELWAAEAGLGGRLNLVVGVGGGVAGVVKDVGVGGGVAGVVKDVGVEGVTLG